MRFRALDLFCGAGGLSLGLSKAGFEIVAAIDNWPVALRSYSRNFPNHATWLENIADLENARLDAGNFKSLDLIAGGPPCQGFSIQRIGSDLDVRNDLVMAFGHIVATLKPRMFVMENVPGLLGKRGVHIVRQLVHGLSAAGYEVRFQLLDAADFGVPQHRRRVFFVGWQSGANFVFPVPTHLVHRTVCDAIGDLRPPPADFSPDPMDPLHRRMRLSHKNLQRLALIPPGGGFEDLPVDMRVDCHREGAAKIGHRAVYGRLDPSQPAATITGRFDSFTRGRFGHPWENRTISLREGARLQSFPDEHLFEGTQEEIAAQIGNAIPPLLAQAMGEAIARHLTGWAGSGMVKFREVSAFAKNHVA
jgi:DNA (cytosine-5)-methyltransferase 1